MIPFAELVGQGPPLVVLHGLFGSGDNWRSVLRPLTERYNVIYVDQRNHGRAPHAPTHDYPSLAADLAELLDHQGWASATLLGHSMGGKTVMQFALTWPERVAALIVADMGMKAYSPHHRNELAGLHAVNLSQISTRQEADAALAEHVAELSTRQFFLKSLYRTEAGAFAWRFNLAGLQANYARILESVEQPGRHYAGPTLFIRGAKSKYVLDTDWPSILPYFPQAELVTIADAGHWVHAEQPAAFVAAVQDFLNRV